MKPVARQARLVPIGGVRTGPCEPPPPPGVLVRAHPLPGGGYRRLWAPQGLWHSTVFFLLKRRLPRPRSTVDGSDIRLPCRSNRLLMHWVQSGRWTRVVLSVWPTEGGKGGWLGGYEGKKTLYVKWASHFWLSLPNFSTPERKIFLVLGGEWFGRAGGGGISPSLR